MRIVHCEKGHIYDGDLYSSCPSCQTEGFRIEFGSGTSVPAGNTGKSIPDPVVPGAVGKTVAASGGFMPAKKPEKTVMQGLFGKEGQRGSAALPVVGWLVCIKGPNAGRAFEIHSDYNYVGSAKGDIVIPGDKKISREKHMRISYDPAERLFFISPDSGANIIRHKGKVLVGAARLHNYDLIETGDSSFMFMAFCSEQFGWDDVDSEDSGR